MSRIATIFGASGEQGSSVLNAVLKDGTFKPRVVTRNTNSESSKKFVDLGAEVVQADSGDRESLKKALAGSEVVFLVTFLFGATSEFDQGKNVIDISKEVGVKFLVFSSLPSLTELSKGKYTQAFHFDDKQKIQKYLDASGLPYASISTGWFLENFLKVNRKGQPTFEKTDHGYVYHAFGFPGMAYAVSWIQHDLGQTFVTLGKQYNTRPDEVLGQNFVIGIARPKVEDIVKELSKGLGAPVELKYEGKIGLAPFDEMYASAAELDWYPGVEFPDPRLEKLGVKLGTIEDFARTTLKAHVGA
ncbi:NmrA-domain-containing protein [Schizophyllum commune H4-8]|uniref:NmrA-like domain-containing protein n=1 Tax=Schizophyllum commune (strain H4-8 / FGSC 9210) TaxID=578458 RepID=D8PW47_SCHCM|nr:NmrA-domain-containing protein [Schizophyllum commune H4-8]KAI5900093.1 NmrA-domain-containing protein [Schizophyllum commune H4-8]